MQSNCQPREGLTAWLQLLQLLRGLSLQRTELIQRKQRFHCNWSTQRAGTFCRLCSHHSVQVERGDHIWRGHASWAVEAWQFGQFHSQGSFCLMLFQSKSSSFPQHLNIRSIFENGYCFRMLSLPLTNLMSLELSWMFYISRLWLWVLAASLLWFRFFQRCQEKVRSMQESMNDSSRPRSASKHCKLHSRPSMLLHFCHHALFQNPKLDHFINKLSRRVCASQDWLHAPPVMINSTPGSRKGALSPWPVPSLPSWSACWQSVHPSLVSMPEPNPLCVWTENAEAEDPCISLTQMRSFDSPSHRKRVLVHRQSQSCASFQLPMIREWRLQQNPKHGHGRHISH